ncbi:uncharacterized protein LOC114311532 [Camellia sinensis]|uniref:uncharacterized protein LOC114311532 n=1 Tax=Camellia sinensis TaxID=4442 RepID=UPI0010357703|nr:uncharacterized protein LOC114311532 [Camellia sinensis]
MVTEYVEMGSLYHLIHVSGLKKRLSWRRRVKMICDICSDYLFKLLLIGDSGVGKSCLLLRFAKLLFCCLILLLSSVLFLTVTARSPIFKALPSIEKDNMPLLEGHLPGKDGVITTHFYDYLPVAICCWNYFDAHEWKSRSYLLSLDNIIDLLSIFPPEKAVAYEEQHHDDKIMTVSL